MSRKYGNQPTPPSDSAILRRGYLRKTGDHARSAAACTMFIGCSVAVTSNGASAEVTTIDDDEPMWRLGTISMSWQAAQNGSQ